MRINFFSQKYFKRVKNIPEIKTLFPFLFFLWLLFFIKVDIYSAIISYSIIQSSDDCHQKADSTVSIGSPMDTLMLMGGVDTTYGPWKGLRFSYINIPYGSAVYKSGIDSTYLWFTAPYGLAYLNAPYMDTIWAEAVDSSATFTATPYLLNRKPRTTSRVDCPYSGNVASGGEHSVNTKTIDISSIVQEIVNRSGWKSGNAITFLLKGSTTSPGKWWALQYDNASAGHAAHPCTLHIQYQAPPTIQADSITFSSVTSTGMTINWTNGNGTNRAVFVKETSSGTAEPLVGTTYTASTVFGSGSQIGSSGWYCVYNGTGNSVVITGLTRGTFYRVMICEYNYNGIEGSTAYLTTAFNGNLYNQIAYPNLALGKPVVTSYNEGPLTVGSNAVDGMGKSYWSSYNPGMPRDSDWIYVDLGTGYYVDSVYIDWGTTAAQQYRIQGTNQTNATLRETDAPWIDLAIITDGLNDEDRIIPLGGSHYYRYIRMRGDTRTTSYGYSIWEFQVFGDTNHAPTDISLSNSSQDENTAINTTIGTLSCTDAENNMNVTYSLVATGDYASFNISGTSLRNSVVFDYETKSSYNITIRVTDEGGLYYDKAFTITVNNLNETPTDIFLSNSTINQNASIGTTVGIFSTQDGDTGQLFSYSLVSGTGSTDNDSFTINGNELKTARILNPGNYSIRVRSTDNGPGNLYYEKTFLITVNSSNYRYWTNMGGNGYWGNASNWSGCVLPSINDTVIFDTTVDNCILNINDTVASILFTPTYSGIFDFNNKKLSVNKIVNFNYSLLGKVKSNGFDTLELIGSYPKKIFIPPKNDTLPCLLFNSTSGIDSILGNDTIIVNSLIYSSNSTALELTNIKLIVLGNLYINNGSIFASSSMMSIAGNFNINNGYFNAPNNSELQISGSFIQTGGNFYAGNGKVVFNSNTTGESYIQANSDFWKLAINSSSSKSWVIQGSGIKILDTLFIESGILNLGVSTIDSIGKIKCGINGQINFGTSKLKIGSNEIDFSNIGAIIPENGVLELTPSSPSTALILSSTQKMPEIYQAKPLSTTIMGPFKAKGLVLANGSFQLPYTNSKDSVGYLIANPTTYFYIDDTLCIGDSAYLALSNVCSNPNGVIKFVNTTDKSFIPPLYSCGYFPRIIKSGNGSTIVNQNRLITPKLKVESGTFVLGTSLCDTIDTIECLSGTLQFNNCTLAVSGNLDFYSGTAHINAGNGVIKLTGNAMQTLIPVNNEIHPQIIHTGAGELHINNNKLIAKGFINETNAGSIYLHYQDIEIVDGGNFIINPTNHTAIINGLENRTITAQGKVKLLGQQNYIMSLSPMSTWTISAGDSLYAEYVELGNCHAVNKRGIAKYSNNLYNNTNWTFIKYWTNNNGAGDMQWNNAINWNPAQLPTHQDSLIFTGNQNCYGIMGSDTVQSIVFTSYTGNFYFNYETLTVLNVADLTDAGYIDSGYGAIKFISADTNYLYGNLFYTLPTIIKKGLGTIIAKSKFKTKNLLVEEGIFEFGNSGFKDTITNTFSIYGTANLGNNNYIETNILEGLGNLSSQNDTLVINKTANFYGLNFSCGNGVVIIKSQNSKTAELNQGSGKVFNTLILWNNGSNGSLDTIKVQNGNFTINSNLILRQNKSISTPNTCVWKFNEYNPSVTINGNLLIENFFSGSIANSNMFMGSGTWEFKKNAYLPIGNGTGKNATLVFSGENGVAQICSTYIADVFDSLGTIQHTGSDTLKVAGSFRCRNFYQNNGLLDFNGTNISTSNNFEINNGTSNTIVNLANREIVSLGNISLNGTSGNYLNLNPNSTWYVNAQKSLTASYANIKNSDASFSAKWGKPTNCIDEGNNFKWDFFAPVSNITNPANNSYQKYPITINGTFIDSGLGVSKVEITIKNVSSGQYWNGTGWGSITWLLTNLSLSSWSYDASGVSFNDGTYEVVCRATDSAGNVETAFESIIFTIDNSVPYSYITFPTNNLCDSAVSFVYGTATDNGVGICSVMVAIYNQTDNKYYDGSNWTDAQEKWIKANGTTSWSLLLPAFLDGKTYVVKSKAIDSCGNVETPGTGNYFTIDKTSPISIISYPTNNSYISSLSSIYGTATDNSGCGVDTVKLKIYNKTNNTYFTGSEWVSVDSGFILLANGTINWNFSAPSLISGNTYVVKSMAIDHARNKEASDSGVTFTFDNTPPSVTINQFSGNDPTNISPLQFNAVFSEPVVNFSSSKVSITGTASSYIDSISISEASPYNKTNFVIFIYISADIMGTITANILQDAVTDSAGNGNEHSTSSDNTIFFDKVSPVVNITYPVNNAKVNAISSITGGVKDISGSGIASVKLSIFNYTTNLFYNGISWEVSNPGYILQADVHSDTLWNYPASIWTNNNKYIVTAQAYDSAGNVSFSMPDTFTYDSSRPTVVIDQAPTQQDQTYILPINFIVTFSKSIIGFTKEDIIISGTAAGAKITAITELSPFNGTKFNILVDSLSSDGTVILSIPENAVYDSANNKNFASTSSDNIVEYGRKANIVLNPKDTSVITGSEVAFFIEAQGTLPLSYQWQKNQTNINGANDSFYTFSTAMSDSGAQFRCIVCNLFGCDTSQNAILKVNSLSAPQIVLHPRDTTVMEGDTVIFTVTATGSGTLNYQWQYSIDNGTNWGNVTGGSGATSASYSFTSTSSDNGKMFRCVIDNGCGSPVVSNAATLTVCTPPQITMQPQDQNVVSGSAVTYSITAQGTMLTYQWQKSTDNLVWSDISDATSSTYLINAQASDNGIRFRCIVRSKCGDITSASAVLFVNEKPKAQFSASPVSGPAPLMVQFTDSSLGTITKWQWNFGDGYYDTLKTTRHEYTLPGSYTVTLNVDGPAGSDSIKKIAYISVFDTTKPLPVQNIAFSNIGASSVKLTWLASKSVDADSIKIYGSLHSWINNSDSFEYKACLPANVTEYLFTGLPKYGCLLYVSIFVKDLYGNLSEPAKDSVFLLDSVPPQNNLTINLSNIKDTAIFISWKIDTNIKDAKSILMACAYNKKPMYSDMDVFPYKDSTIIITNIKEPGIWYIATSVSDSVKNNSPIRYDSIEIANVPPIFAENKDKNLKEDELFIDTLKAFDINNDKIIYNLLTSLEGLKIDSTKGIILWMPDNNQVGTHSIIVCAKDSRNAITFDTIVYTVVNVNDKPSIIYIGDTNVYEDSVFKGKIIINDPDPQDSCRIVYKKLPDWCMLINDTIKGIPYSGSAGIDSILIVIEDKEGLQDTLNKKINILFTNHSPIIDSCNITKQIDERNLFIATYYGKDIDKNDSISVRWIKKPTWLEIKKINKNNFDFEIYLTGIPFGRDTGLNKYSFDICDKHNSCVNIIDSVFVLDINDAPMAFIDKNKKQVKYGAVKYVVYGKDDFDSVLTFKSKISKLGDTIAIMEKTTNYGEIEFYPLVDGEYEFSVVAIDKNGAFDTSFVKDTFIIKGSTKFSLAGDTLWKMFSVPSKPKSFDGILTNGFIYHWDESFTEKNIYGYYRNAKELIQTTAGYSYWLKSTDTVTINLTEKDLLNDSVNIILSKDKFGWNQIASPYSYPILWNFTSVVWKWNIKTQDFEDAGNILEPWQGYWVAVDTTTNVTFKNIPVFSQPILSKRKAVYFTGPNEWQVRLVFSYNDGQDAANIFGFSSSAKDEYDNSDAPEPPRMNISPYICFYHPEWNKNFTEFAYDIRKNISQVNVFPIAINTFGKKIINAKILLEGQENIKDMYFYIGDENKIEKIEPQKPIIINTESSNKILYKTLFVSNYKNLASYLPPKFYLNMPYPNPMQRSTSIKFALPYSLENIIKNKKNYLVDISIYDVRGRKIRQLVYSRKEPGYYSIIWDGKNNSRILVSNGIYYLKFSAEQFNAVQKIIVSK